MAILYTDLYLFRIRKFILFIFTTLAQVTIKINNFIQQKLSAKNKKLLKKCKSLVSNAKFKKKTIIIYMHLKL